jgi:transcriptional regulator with XRE-family HTH domain
MTAIQDLVLFGFGKNLKYFRKNKNLSQEAFALKCDLDRTYISGLERGKRNPTLKIIALLAKHLDISMSELVSNIADDKYDHQNTE